MLEVCYTFVLFEICCMMTSVKNKTKQKTALARNQDGHQINWPSLKLLWAYIQYKAPAHILCNRELIGNFSSELELNLGFMCCFYIWTGEEPEETDFDMPKVYEPIKSFDSLMERLNMFLSHYNESIRGAGMDMVFFRDAMIHLVKVHRISYYTIVSCISVLTACYHQGQPLASLVILPLLSWEHFQGSEMISTIYLCLLKRITLL